MCQLKLIIRKFDYKSEIPTVIITEEYGIAIYTIWKKYVVKRFWNRHVICNSMDRFGTWFLIT